MFQMALKCTSCIPGSRVAKEALIFPVPSVLWGLGSGPHPRRCSRTWLSTPNNQCVLFKTNVCVSLASPQKCMASRFRFHLGDSRTLSLQIYWGRSERPPGNPQAPVSRSSLLACQRWWGAAMNCLESHAFVHHADVLIPTTTFFLSRFCLSPFFPCPFFVSFF